MIRRQNAYVTEEAVHLGPIYCGKNRTYVMALSSLIISADRDRDHPIPDIPGNIKNTPTASLIEWLQM